MIEAGKEKERLEIKQRKIRKYKEENNIEHQPCYFKEWNNP